MARVQLGNFAPSLTKQSFRDECNINKIVSRYKQTGVMSHQSAKQPHYMDATTAVSYEQAFDIVQQAEAAFAQLPAKVRRNFGNDPGAFAAFASDPANIDQMREWGLAAPAESPAPQPEAEKSEADTPAQ